MSFIQLQEVTNCQITFYEHFQFVDLAETLAFYRDRDPEMVFQEREASRAVGPELLLGGFGMGGEGCYMGGMPAFKTNAKKGTSSMVFTSKH